MIDKEERLRWSTLGPGRLLRCLWHSLALGFWLGAARAPWQRRPFSCMARVKRHADGLRHAGLTEEEVREIAGDVVP